MISEEDIASQNSEKLAMFKTVVGWNDDGFATSFLEAHGWNVEMAVDSFMGAGGGGGGGAGGAGSGMSDAEMAAAMAAEAPDPQLMDPAAQHMPAVSHEHVGSRSGHGMWAPDRPRLIPGVSAETHRLAVRTALATTVAANTYLEEPVLWEVAACDPDHAGEWDGAWELCTLEKDDGECCNVRIVKDGKLCAAVPRRFVRRKSMFLHCPRPLKLQELLECHLDTVHDLRALHTMAVLARDLTSDDPTAVSPSEQFVFENTGKDSLANRPTSTGTNRQSASVDHLQKHLEGLEPEHWWLLAPLLRSRVLLDPEDFTADESGRALRDLLEQRSWWISLLLRAINAPLLLILRKQDALVLAKRLLTLTTAPAGPHQRLLPHNANCTNPSYYRVEAKRELTGLLGAMARAHGFDEPTLAVLRAVAFIMPHELHDKSTLVNDTRSNLLSLLLPGHCHVPPPCSPPLEPLTADLPASSECVALLVDTLARLGTDALALTLLRRMTLRAKRAAACSCRGLRTLIAPHLRAATLHVLAEDATLDNAAFVARLPTLERLHVEGESFLCDGLDIPKLRSLPRIALKTIGVPAALFLGCLLSGGDHTIRLSNGLSCVSLQPITTRDDLSLIVTAAADLAVLLGSLSNNRVLKRLGLPLIIFENDYRGTALTPDALTSTNSSMAAVDGLGEMVVQLGQALRFAERGGGRGGRGGGGGGQGELQPTVQTEQARLRREAGARRAAEAEAESRRVVLGPGIFVRIRRGSLKCDLNELEGLEGEVVAEHSGRWRVQMVGEDAAASDLRSFLPRCLEVQDGQGEWRPALEPEHARQGRA